VLRRYKTRQRSTLPGVLREAWTVEARWYQSEANQAAWQYITDKRGNPLIVLPTGAGKSIVIALLIRQAEIGRAHV
jgi:superfamily II DNA or RNA helicase